MFFHPYEQVILSRHVLTSAPWPLMALKCKTPPVFDRGFVHQVAHSLCNPMSLFQVFQAD